MDQSLNEIKTILKPLAKGASLNDVYRLLYHISLLKYLSNLIVYSVLSYCEFEKNHTKPLLVYVDEFQTVVSDLFADLLARSRSSKVGFVLAHHDFAEIDKQVLSSILGNVDINVIFRCGDTEAERFAGIFDIKTKDLIDLGEYQAWVKIGTSSTLVATYPPLMEEVPMLDIKRQKSNVRDFCFLREGWMRIFFE